MKHLLISAGLLVSCLPQPGQTASSAWHEVEGGGVRLVTTGQPDGEGNIRGALEIALNPGWKTYWRDPGDAGVPPTIDILPSSNIQSAILEFPAPHRFDDGYAVWAGYKDPVSLPITFRTGGGISATLIDADVFIGICENICVPVQARLSLDPLMDADNPDDKAAVDAAFAALPGPASADFGVVPVPGTPENMVVRASVPTGSADEELFLAASDGYVFGVPERRFDRDKLIFSIPILDRPAARPEQGELNYTLSTSRGAVSGAIPFP